jgi:hypothetical protein
VKEGIPKEARGQYNPIKCGARYVRYLPANFEKKTTADGGGYITLRERTRLGRAKREFKEIELAKNLELWLRSPISKRK